MNKQPVILFAARKAARAVPDYTCSGRHLHNLHPGAALGVRVHDRARVPKAV
jgi:hypothetical protein